MPFSWPGKKDEPEASPKSKLEFPEALAADLPPPSPPKAVAAPPVAAPPVVAKGEAAGLEELTRRYGQLGMALEQANQQTLAYLIERSQAAGGGTLAERLEALSAKIDRLSGGGPATAFAAAAGGDASSKGASGSVLEKLDQLDARFKALSEKAAAIDALKEAFVPTLVKVRDGLSEQHAALGGGIRQVQQQFDEGLRALAAMLQPVIAHFQPPPDAAPLTGDWQEAILGRELAEHPGLNYQRQRLLAGFLQGEPAACSLVGQLLVFRSSPAEKMPTLLKDIGEAYYRWNPRTSGKADEMENALVAWLQQACDRVGMSNTIELVHPGQRFDSMRHNAAERGVEITQVLGWIVLRDNGKVYTKASVAVK
jgi:hypothetical protein